jgi:hypothetical protein
MRKILATLIGLLWGLWFGGVIMLFIAVGSLFKTFPDRHDIAGQGAARIFHLFNAYQLALGALALIGTVVWRALGPPRLKEALFTLFAMTTVVASVISIYIAPQIELLQKQGLTQSPEFARMHGFSMLAYVAEAVFLASAGLLLPWVRE